MTQEEWRNIIDDKNIEFRRKIYNALIKPVNGTNVLYLSRQISGFFGHIFDPYGILPNISLKIEELDGGLDIYWNIPKEEYHCSGKIEYDNSEDSFWHFNLKLMHEYKELYDEDMIARAFN